MKTFPAWMEEVVTLIVHFTRYQSFQEFEQAFGVKQWKDMYYSGLAPLTALKYALKPDDELAIQ